MSDFENDVLGFDPSQLSVFNEDEKKSSAGNPLIYRTRPADSVSEDGVYRATIKIIYSPQDLKHSVLEQQSYAMQDAQGWFSVVSSLTNNDTSCPIFTGWKKCHYADPGSALWKQAAKLEEGGKALFDKRFARYVTVQVIEDKNQPELEGKYLFWKLPKSVWDIVNAKMAPSPESKKAPVPVMDFLFGRAFELEVTPGPDDKQHPERKTRETKYSGELTEDVVSCTNPDGSPLLNDAEQAVLDEYVEDMNKNVWKNKDPEDRTAKKAAINQKDNTKELGKIYTKVIEQIKTFCPDLNKELGYKAWTEEQTKRVNAWLNAVVNELRDPSKDMPAADVVTDVASSPVGNTPSEASVETAPVPQASNDDDDLPF